MLNTTTHPAATEPAETPAVEPAAPTEAPAVDPAPAPEEEEPEAPAAPEPAAPAETPSASAQLSAFDRTALRMLGKGDLVARITRAEGRVAELEAKLAAAAAENSRLVARMDELGQETAAQVEQAAQAREDALARGVQAELASLGIAADAAPAQVTAAEAEKVLTRAEFEKLDHSARNAFMRSGGKIRG